jgi:hypothetical protein
MEGKFGVAGERSHGGRIEVANYGFLAHCRGRDRPRGRFLRTRVSFSTIVATSSYHCNGGRNA